MPKTLNYIDIFAGCGGLSAGLQRAGWKGFFAVEKDPMAFATLKHNLIAQREHFDWPAWLPQREYSIGTLLRSYTKHLQQLAGKITLIAGGPPCQGFSINGKRKVSDKRNALVNSYIRMVDIVKPEFLFFENVRGFTMEFSKSGAGVVYSNSVTKRLQRLGYSVHAEIIDFSEFSIPQRRLRFILVGSKAGDAKTFFSLLRGNHTDFHSSRGLKARYTVSQAISDLARSTGEVDSPDTRRFKNGIYGRARNQFQFLLRQGAPDIPDSHRFVNHAPKTVNKFKKILDKARRDRHLSAALKKTLGVRKRSITPLAANAVCPTLTSLPDDLIHYKEPRVLTVREYARIQSFDDDFHFKGEYTSGGDRRTYQVPRYTQIGNAVPPLFAEQAGLALRAMVEADAKA